MKKSIKRIISVCFLTFILSSNLFSQTLNETLSSLSSGAVLKYSQPVIDAFGSNMNSGWFTGLPASTNGFHSKLRAVGVGSFLSDDLRSFTYIGVLRLTSEQVDEILISSGLDPNFFQYYEEIKNEILSKTWEVKFEGPTITGNLEEYLTIEFPETVIQGQVIDSYTLEMPDVKGYLNNIDLLPSPALQLDLGSVIGTGVSFRYFRGINLMDLGMVNVWGAGVIHNFNYWFEDPIPVEIGFGYYFQNFNIGEIFKNRTSMYGLFISKKIGSLISIEPYLGLTYETSRSEIDYTYEFDSPAGSRKLQINIDYGGDKSLNLTLGSTINLSIFVLNFDYKFGRINTGTAGIGFGF